MRLKLIFLVFPFFLVAQQKKRVLFIGNSYTYVNTLPQLLADLALSNGDTLQFDSYTPGGYTFANHFSDAMTRSKIAAGNWTHVILQAQSQEPSFSPAQVAAQTLPFAIRLDSLVQAANPCTQTVFYETWGRKSGDAYNCPVFPPVCTYTGMQGRLKSSYKLFADSCKALMAPVGEAWRSSISYSPALELYQSDQSHPAIEGSFLAAAVFYEVLYRRSVLTSTYSAGLPTGIRSFLLQRAHQTVNDSLSVWNLGRFEPDASFSILQSGNTFSLTGKNQNFNHNWNFGDGTQSSLTSPVHQYAVTGTYTISHMVFDNCQSAVEEKMVLMMTGLSPEIPAGNQPNLRLKTLFGDAIQLPASLSDCQLRISNALGQAVWQGIGGQLIDTVNWPLGMYLIQCDCKVSNFAQKLLKTDEGL